MVCGCGTGGDALGCLDALVARVDWCAVSDRVELGFGEVTHGGGDVGVGGDAFHRQDLLQAVVGRLAGDQFSGAATSGAEWVGRRSCRIGMTGLTCGLAASTGASGLWVVFSSRSASSRVSSSLSPDLTHTRTVRHCKALAASSRRKPQMRWPSGVMVMGWSSPTRFSESIKGVRSPGSRRCRWPTTMEST